MACRRQCFGWEAAFHHTALLQEFLPALYAALNIYWLRLSETYRPYGGEIPKHDQPATSRASCIIVTTFFDF